MDVLATAVNGGRPSDAEALALASWSDTGALMEVAGRIRDQAFGNGITFSKKVFIPLTHLCRDVCHYCTFAQPPRTQKAPFMTEDEVLEVASRGAELGCKEALFTLGEKPELRYSVAREALATMGYDTTLEYLHDVAGAVFRETGLLPHLNSGTMSGTEIRRLRGVSASMGLMLESASERLCERGMPHFGSPDKDPAVRLRTIAEAGKARVPFTTGILIGIGETREERIESLLAIRALHERYGHIQEIIVQNFRAKPDTKMADAPEPDLDELLWTLAVAKIVFGPDMSIQAPPNLSPGVLPRLVSAGIDDWGGVSPLTPDFVNPEAPWPHLDQLAEETARSGKHLHERLTIYPAYARDLETWVDPELRSAVLGMIDAEGYPRTDGWAAGERTPPPDAVLDLMRSGSGEGNSKPGESASRPDGISGPVSAVLDRLRDGEQPAEADVETLFRARGEDFRAVVRAADALRERVNGDVVSYVITRNINYTNVCYFKCQFCAFSKGRMSENLRGRPYDLPLKEIQQRAVEAWDRGGTEVCMQGGIHPDYTGETYLRILRAVKEAVPGIHVHAFSPLEVWQGAATLGVPLKDYLERLKEAGLGSLPGTAAEILDDEVRAVLCPDKIDTAQWLEVMETAHEVGLRSTATIMFGHVDRYRNWARHLLRIRALQAKTGGFTELVPLPFVHREAPIYRKGRARRGPTFREAVLMHAVARLVLHPHITNIQGSWVKLGREGVVACLDAGVNDLGGTLMNESITRAAGAEHGQEILPDEMRAMIETAGRRPRLRNTLYGDVERASARTA